MISSSSVVCYLIAFQLCEILNITNNIIRRNVTVYLPYALAIKSGECCVYIFSFYLSIELFLLVYLLVHRPKFIGNKKKKKTMSFPSVTTNNQNPSEATHHTHTTLIHSSLESNKFI